MTASQTQATRITDVVLQQFSNEHNREQVLMKAATALVVGDLTMDDTGSVKFTTGNTLTGVVLEAKTTAGGEATTYHTQMVRGPAVINLDNLVVGAISAEIVTKLKLLGIVAR